MNAKFNKGLIESLLAKEKGYTLTEEEQQEVDKVVVAINAIYKKIGNTGANFFKAEAFDTLYLGMRLADKAFWEPESKPELKSEKIDTIGCFVAYNLIDSYGQDFFKKFPLAVPYLEMVVDYVTPSILYAINENHIWLDAVAEENFRKYFGNINKFYEYIKNKDLHDMLNKMSECNLLLAWACKTGTGIDQDLVKAFWYMRNYRCDFLLQICGTAQDHAGNEFEELFEALKKDADEGKTYPGLYFSLAIMYREGLGTTYNYDAYLDCFAKETDKEFAKSLSSYNKIKINTYRNGDPIKVVKKITDNLEVGDIVDYGKYNHRSVLWEVLDLDVEENKALLFCTECLESTDIAEEAEKRISLDGFGGPFSKYLTYEFILNTNFSEDLPIATRRGFAFLLTKDEVERYMPKKEDRFCGARLQAICNGHDGYGVEYNCRRKISAPWWTETEDKNGNRAFVAPNGKIDKVNISFANRSLALVNISERKHFELCFNRIGIRPAVWVKVNK